MKVFILTDLEGVSGVNARSDGIGINILNEEEAGRLLAGEVNAAVEGLIEAGAKEIVVLDGHGDSKSIPIELLHPQASLFQLGDGFVPAAFMEPGEYDAALQIGAHAMAGVADGYLNHTFNSRGVVWMKLNGEPIGEIGIHALCAAACGTPTILVSGCQAACREAVEFLGAVGTVQTKKAFSRYSAINRTPAAVRASLRAASALALRNLRDFPLKQAPTPCLLEVKMMSPDQAGILEMNGADRHDAQTVAWRGDNILDVFAQRSGWAKKTQPT